jgi:hypothetical protein
MPAPGLEAYNHLSPGAAEAKGDLTSRAASIPPLPLEASGLRSRVGDRPLVGVDCLPLDAIVEEDVTLFGSGRDRLRAWARPDSEALAEPAFGSAQARARLHLRLD